MTTFDVYFNSGETYAVHYQEGDRLSYLEITNSDQEYYQGGIVELFNVPTGQIIGDTALILINDTQQFNGYIADIQEEILKGKKMQRYRLVGKTYDLWRYKTDSDAIYTGQTAYIVSSMVATYCTGISGGGVDPTEGSVVTDDLDLTNMVVGEAIIRLTEIDGYKFYVDNDSNLQYFYPEDVTYGFTVEEDDIYQMNPIEQSDEDIINDVLVVGGTGYSKTTTLSSTYPSSSAFPSGVLVAQQFLIEDNILSAVKAYLHRTTGDDAPTPLSFEIWGNAAKELFNDDFDDWTYLGPSSNVMIEGSKLMLKTNVTETEQSSYYSGAYPQKPYLAQVFLFDNNVSAFKAQFYLGADTEDGLLWFEIRTTTGTTKYPTTTILCSGTDGKTTHGAGWTDWIYFRPQVQLTASTNYAVVMHVGGVNDVEAPRRLGYTYIGRYGWQSDDGSTWSLVGGGAYDLNYKIIGRTFQPYGVVSSQTFMEACQYMKLDISGMISSSKIWISGSNDSGSTWDALSDGDWYDFGSESSTGTLVKYILSSNGSWTPEIDLANLQIGDAQGSSSASPLSGSAIEWSNQISWSDEDVPYPPDWSDWQTYSLPKLSGSNWYNNSYWMVFTHPSSNSQYWTYYYDPNSSYNGRIMYSWDGGVNWSGNSNCPELVPEGNMCIKLGWKEGDILATATNQDSIDTFGRHFKKITDSSVNTYDVAQALADMYVSGSDFVPRKGTLTINGLTDISVNYKFSANLSNFGIGETFKIVSYTQTIDNRGFTTTINYGKQPFNIVKNIADLEKQVYSGD